jgi:hypothetical protein
MKKAMFATILLAAVTAAGWEVVRLSVPPGAKEAVWRDALARAWTGRVEVAVAYGRVDVLTEGTAVELDFAHKYHEALGQALHYSHETGRQGVAALIVTGQIDGAKMEWIEALCNRHGVRLVILIRGNAHKIRTKQAQK